MGTRARVGHEPRQFMIHRNESSGTAVVGQLTCLYSVSRLGGMERKTADDNGATADCPGSFCRRFWFHGSLGSHLFTGGNWFASGLSRNVVRRSRGFG